MGSNAVAARHRASTFLRRMLTNGRQTVSLTRRILFLPQVIVARLDKKPLSIDALEVIWMFCDGTSELAAEGDLSRSELEARYKPAAFQKWCVDYKESYKEFGRLQTLEFPL